jgi:hypothetical protein
MILKLYQFSRHSSSNGGTGIMKATATLICMGSLYAGALWAEYQIALLFGTGCFLLVGGSALAVIAAALRRAPEGNERADGFHIRLRKRPTGFVSAVRPAQRQMRRGWT